MSDEGWFFGEDGARALVSCAPADVAALQRLAAEHGTACHYLGLVGKPEGELVVRRDGRHWAWKSRALREIHLTAIPRRMSAAEGV